MFGEIQSFDFPKQRIPSSQKKKKEWYANCCDWVIAQAQNYRNDTNIDILYQIVQGNIPPEYYAKILNPYNAKEEKYKRFPATMRNYDMIKGNVRRYVSEYIKNPHEFIVGANNPEVVLARNNKLREELTAIVQQQIIAEIQKQFQEYLNQGGDPQQFNPQEQFDAEAYIKEFNENYIDDISEQGQQILNVIKDITDDAVLYAETYFNYIAYGECYTYADVRGTKLVKENVKPIDMYPVPNDNLFVEDYDMCARRRKMTYQQIIDEFGDYLTDEEYKFLETYYARKNVSSPTEIPFCEFNAQYPSMCEKYTSTDTELFKNKKVLIREANTDLYDVWHAVWRGEVRKAIVTFVNENQMIDQRIENDDYKLNIEAGDISITYEYQTQVYESYRIGTRQTAIYPIKARAIAYDRNGKLPYNGLCELLPGFGKFSIVETVIPYQVFYNIVAYHREMAIAKNKLYILMIAKSLLGKKPEDTIYKMIADGVLYIDDENDQGMLRAQQVRILQADISNYIKSLSELLAEVENAAKMQVDMTPQRYGEIANSAGKGVTDEAVMRGSMGTVIIEFMMDSMRERDYSRDMDYSKLAWIDGLDTSYRDAEGGIKYMSLNVDRHIYADYVIKAKNSVKEKEKLDQIRQFAFNMGQNGNDKMAIAAITGDNIATIKKLINKFSAEKDAHEQQMKEMDQQLEQMKQQFELEKIHAKGEEDRLTKQIEAEADIQIELLKADANMISFDNGIDARVKEAGVERLNEARAQLDRDKLNLEREKAQMDAFNKYQDRQVKLKDIDTKLQIARTNKNRYDKK